MAKLYLKNRSNPKERPLPRDKLCSSCLLLSCGTSPSFSSQHISLGWDAAPPKELTALTEPALGQGESAPLQLGRAAKPCSSTVISHAPVHTCSHMKCKAPDMWMNNNLNPQHCNSQRFPTISYICLNTNQVKWRYNSTRVNTTKS